MALATQVGAEDISNENYSTDNKLLSEVKTRMVLDNGLVVHIWEWQDSKNLSTESSLSENPPFCLTRKSSYALSASIIALCG